MCCLDRSIENSALAKLLPSKTYMININERKENFVITEHFGYILCLDCTFYNKLQVLCRNERRRVKMTVLLQIARELRHV